MCVYFGILILILIGFLLVGVIWIWIVFGILDFELWGILNGKIDEVLFLFFLVFYMFGIGKVVLMFFYCWLFNVMVVLILVSVLLYVVVVVKVGVFIVFKVMVYIFGVDFLSIMGVLEWLMWFVVFIIFVLFLIVMIKDNFKVRFVYLIIS